MPELPEVETIRQDLQAKIINQTIIKIEVRQTRIIRNSLKKFQTTLTKAKFSKVERIGKLLMFKISPGTNWLLIHLKMTGQLIYKNKKDIIAGGHSFSANNFKLPHKHTHVIFEFKNGAKLFFNDLRQFGYMRIISASDKKKFIKANFGIEPLTDEFTLGNFKNIFKNRKTSIKAVLLNQKLITGLGNIYVDESCFAAGIRPNRIVKSLTDAEIVKLYSAINKIIKQAIKYRGTTFNNYVDTSGQTGNFSKHLQVYGRQGQPCQYCGHIIQKIKLAGRGTHFCSQCQK